MNWKNELEKIYAARPVELTNKVLSKEIILYGAGSLGHMACDLLKKAKIKPKYIVDKNAKGDIDGVKIISPDEISLDDKDTCLFVICIATVPYNGICEFLKDLGIKNLIQFYTYAYIKFPKLLLNGWTAYNLTNKEKAEVKKVCEALSHDELSIHHYLQFLWWKVRGIEFIYEKYPVLSGKKYFKSPYMPELKENEVLLDAGTHYGQTIEGFVTKVNDKYKNIYAFEPDEKNFAVVKEKFSDKRIIYSTKAIYNETGVKKFQNGLGFASKIDKNGNKAVDATTIDDLNLAPTIIKIHTEGDELKGLEGAINTIKKHKPVVIVMADHHPEGLYKIAAFLYTLSGYRLYFNLHDYCGNTAVFYAIPNERLKN